MRASSVAPEVVGNRDFAWHPKSDSAAKRYQQRPGGPQASGAPVARLTLGVLGFVVAVALTFLGLLAITFFIGRVIPIDPVLAVVGDRAPRGRLRGGAASRWGSTSRWSSSSSTMSATC